MISFEPRELIILGITVISIGLNVTQFIKRKSTFKPISNSLIGLFNDVKNKTLLCSIKQMTLFSKENPHTEIITLKWDISSFLFSLIQALYGFQEHIVASLKTLEVSDREVFKATDFGLTEKDKEMRELWDKRYKEGLLTDQKSHEPSQEA